MLSLVPFQNKGAEIRVEYLVRQFFGPMFPLSLPS